MSLFESSCDPLLENSAMFTHRIVSVDFCTSYPQKEFDAEFSEFRQHEVTRVPVIRIFGSTPQGQKTTAHIHGIFPYITILYNSSIENFEKRLSNELDRAINEFLKSTIVGHSLRSGGTHVFNVTKIHGRTFYGYRSEEEVFLRIYFYNPLVIKKAVDLLSAGSILGTSFQPYEAHIPYQLQFMIDYNLYGMNLIHYTAIKFRRKHGCIGMTAKAQNSSESLNFKPLLSGGVMKYWELSQLPEKMFSSETLEKVTTCELEIDVLAKDIVISMPTSNVKSTNPGIDSIWKDEIERRKQHLEENWSQITIPSSQERDITRKYFPTEVSYLRLLEEKLSHVGSKDPSFENQSSLEESIPSSQVQKLAPYFSSNHTLSNEDFGQNEDEELLNLLYQMQQEKEDNEKLDEENEIEWVDPEFKEDNSDNEDQQNHIQTEHTQWNQSYLSQSIIDEFMTDEDGVFFNTPAESKQNKNKDAESITIFQGDGQADDTDSNEESEHKDILVVTPTRRSSRVKMSNAASSNVLKKCPKKKQELISNLEKYSPKSTTQSSPVKGRLSLSVRRKPLSKSSYVSEPEQSQKNSQPKRSEKAKEFSPLKSLLLPVVLTPNKTKSATSNSNKDESNLEIISVKNSANVDLVMPTRISTRIAKRRNSLSVSEISGGEFSFPSKQGLKANQKVKKSEKPEQDDSKSANNVEVGKDNKIFEEEEQMTQKDQTNPPVMSFKEKETVKVKQCKSKEKWASVKSQASTSIETTITDSKCEKQLIQTQGNSKTTDIQEKKLCVPIMIDKKGMIADLKSPNKNPKLAIERISPLLIQKVMEVGVEKAIQDLDSVRRSSRILSRLSRKDSDLCDAEENSNESSERKSKIDFKSSESLNALAAKIPNQSDVIKKTKEISKRKSLKGSRNNKRSSSVILRNEPSGSIREEPITEQNYKDDVIPKDTTINEIISTSNPQEESSDATGHANNLTYYTPIAFNSQVLSEPMTVESILDENKVDHLYPDTSKTMTALSVVSQDNQHDAIDLDVEEGLFYPRVIDKTSIRVDYVHEVLSSQNEDVIIAPVFSLHTEKVTKSASSPKINDNLISDTSQTDSFEHLESVVSLDELIGNQKTVSVQTDDVLVLEVYQLRQCLNKNLPMHELLKHLGLEDYLFNEKNNENEEIANVSQKSQLLSSNEESVKIKQVDINSSLPVEVPIEMEVSSPSIKEPQLKNIEHNTQLLNATTISEEIPIKRTQECSEISKRSESKEEKSLDLKSSKPKDTTNENILLLHEEDITILTRPQKNIKQKTFFLSTSNVRQPSQRQSNSASGYKSYVKRVLSRRKSTDVFKSHEEEKVSPLVPKPQPLIDLSVESLYEFGTPPLVDIEEDVDIEIIEKDDIAPEIFQSFFEIKRSASRSKARQRRFKKLAYTLEKNLGAPDIFEDEYQPMKKPKSFRWVEKFVLNEETGHNPGQSSQDNQNIRVVVDKKKELFNEDSSDEEPIEDVRKCFGESSSDNDDDEHSSIKDDSIVRSRTPPLSNEFDLEWTEPPSQNNDDRSQKSIIKQKSNEPIKFKRKLNWEDAPDRRNNKKILRVQKPENLNTSVLKDFDRSELDGPSLKNQFGFAHDMSNLQDAKALHQYQYITLMSVEVLCKVRGDLLPDPKIDPIDAIFIYVSNDVPEHFRKPKYFFKCMLTHPVPHQRYDSSCEYYASENELFEAFIQLFHELDPDMLVGYENEKMSWGYIIDRGSFCKLEMTQILSRNIPRNKSKQGFIKELKLEDPWDGLIVGRIVLNLWRLMRHEMTVQSYTYENAAYHILHRKVCRFSHKMLAELWNEPKNRYRVIEYFTERVKGVVELMNKLDMINRTSELARLFGIQFYEVFSRGSQFRVESMMLRTTKPLNLIAPSPSVMQRSKMRAPEYLPLILEPQSSYYTDPVAVLDFQSLYPSMIIAYNYDYATILGRVEHLGEESVFEMGCLENSIPPHILKELKDHIHISPAGVAFVDSKIRRGILPEMLEQILDTRQMVKRAMKKWKNEGATLHKILDSRQLGLKLISNVTYGYTSANFSGRMPCVEIADSVVSKGRETLQRAIDLVKSNRDRWGAEVIYGDTDSMFVRFPGKNRQEAFKLAQNIADEVTQSNPKPVKLKLEKIYQPCILQSKKRYVGYSYETPDQEKPTYDAKGIETILEKSLHVLFTTNDADKVKNFVQLQFKKLFTGRVSMKEYTFAREFRGRQGYKPGACVPSLEIAKRATEKDPRAEPLKKERVPYVVVYGKATLPLIQLTRTPGEFVNDYTLRLNAHYYIEKAIIPALNRCLALAKIDVSQWYKNLPRKYLRSILDDNKLGHGTLDDFVQHTNCFRCDEKTQKGICLNCDQDLQVTSSYLLQSTSELGRKLEISRQICEACSGDDDKCINADCPVFHKLLRYERDEYYNKQLLVKLKDIEFC